MGARLYVGNLAYGTQADGLRQLVEDAGHSVADIHIVTDRETGRSRGFAFVELAEGVDLPAAIASLDGQDLDGRRLAVSEARPRQPREAGPPKPRGGRFEGRPEPSRDHRRPNPDGPRRAPRPGFGDGAPRSGERTGGPKPFDDRRPRREPSFGGPPPPGSFGPPPEFPPKDEGRRRNKKKKETGRSDTWDEGRNRDGERGGRKRRGGGRKGGGWDNKDDW